MRIRLLLIASILCVATYGCETTPTEPQSAAQPPQPRSEPRVGSRIPSSVQPVLGISREEWEDSRRVYPSGTGMGR